MHDPSADRGMADKAYKALQKGAGESVPKRMKAEDAMRTWKHCLVQELDGTEAAHVAALAACTTNMRSSDPAD